MNETVQENVSIDKETPQSPSETLFKKVVGISEAANLTGRSKGQIGRDSNTSRLKYTSDEKGRKRYKVSDLFQLYGFRNPDETSLKDAKRPDETSGEIAVEMAVLKADLRAKEDALRRSEEEVRDLRQSRDRLLDQNNRLTMLLPSPVNQAVTAMTEQEKPAKSKRKQWWKIFS